MSAYTYPVIVVEIPHQQPAFAWPAHSADDILAAACALADRDGCEDAQEYRALDSPTVEDAIELLGHDLNSLRVVTRSDYERDGERCVCEHGGARGRLMSVAWILGWPESAAREEVQS